MDHLVNYLLGWPVLVLLCAIAWWLYQLYREAKFRRWARDRGCLSPPKSSTGWPWNIDNIWKLYKLTVQRGDILNSFVTPAFDRLGWTFLTPRLLGTDSVWNADPDNMREVLSTQFKDFPVGSQRHGAFSYMMGKCLFTVDGPEWEHSRAMFRPHFARGEINDTGPMERGMQNLLKEISARGLDNSWSSGDNDAGLWTPVIDIRELFSRYTLDTGAEVFLGTKIDSQPAANPDAVAGHQDSRLQKISRNASQETGVDLTFSDAFNLGNLAIAKRLRSQGLYWLVDSEESRHAVRYLRSFVGQVVNEQLRRKPSDEANKKATLLEGLAQITQDPIVLRDETIMMLVAARDTTSNLLSFLFIFLAKHPIIFEKLRMEIIKEFGTKDTPKNISFYGAKRCHYLQWTLSETLRLKPGAALNVRVAAKDTVLPSGGGLDGKSPIAVRKGQVVVLSTYNSQRRRDVWGDDAEDFKPERWEDRKVDWSYQPFSGGPRACPGKEFALAEAAVATIKLLQEFDALEPADELTTRQFLTTALEPTDGARMRLRRAR